MNRSEITDKLMIFFGCLIGSIIGTLLGTIIAHGYEYTPKDMVEIARVVHQEAGNQSELGKRLVTDTILNRVDSEDFPNTPHEVIIQPEQYAMYKTYAPEELYSIIADEIYNQRTNTQVLWFRKYRYHKYGEPIIKEGDHYFSGRIDDET